MAVININYSYNDKVNESADCKLNTYSTCAVTGATINIASKDR